MRPRAEGFISRVAAAARPARPWLQIKASPRVAQFLIAAGARPGRTTLPSAGLTTAKLACPNLHESILTNADLHHADLADADLTGADLSGADLRGADMRGAVLTGAVLTGADLSEANLTGAHLPAANLVRADLCRVILTSAVLTDVVLVEANLTGAHLRGTNLRSAILAGANLAGADLADAILTDADLARVLWSSGTSWPANMASLMRNRSEELRPGIWRVIGSGNAGAETEDPLVPVELAKGCQLGLPLCGPCDRRRARSRPAWCRARFAAKPAYFAANAPTYSHSWPLASRSCAVLGVVSEALTLAS
jgi:uncharacterized protein YjbI with pentapeptide repeats